MTTYRRLLISLSFTLILLAGPPAIATDIGSSGRDYGYEAVVIPSLSIPNATPPDVGGQIPPPLADPLPPAFPPNLSYSPLSGDSLMAARLSKIKSRVSHTRKTVSYVACEARPPIIYSRITLLAFRALYDVRAVHCVSYYRNKPRRARLPPIRAPLPPILPLTLLPPPPPPPPPADPTEGTCLVPTRTYTTSEDRPAEPTPAHAPPRRRFNLHGEESEETATSDSMAIAHWASLVSQHLGSPWRRHRPQATWRPAWTRRLWALAPRMRVDFGLLVLIIPPLFFLMSLVMRKLGKGYGWGHLFDDYPGTTSRPVVHFAYRLRITAPLFWGGALRYEESWTDSGELSESQKLENIGWFDVGAKLRRLEREHANERLLGVEVELVRTRTVFDVVELPDGSLSPVMVEELCVGPETFLSRTEFKSDSQVPERIETLAGASPFRAGVGR